MSTWGRFGGCLVCYGDNLNNSVHVFLFVYIFVYSISSNVSDLPEMIGEYNDLYV